MGEEMWDQHVWVLRHGSADMAGKEWHTLLSVIRLFSQAVPPAASSDGMDEGGHSSCRTSQESAGGQR